MCSWAFGTNIDRNARISSISPGKSAKSIRVPGGITSLGGSRHVDLELLVVHRRPDLHDVAAERAARLGADGDHDRLERRALLEARRHREDPVERLAGAPLELVQPGALERLTAEIGCDARQRVRTSAVIASGSANGNPIAPASRSPTKTGTASAPDAYGASAAPSGNCETNSCRRCAQAGLPSRAAVVIGARVVSGKRVRRGEASARCAPRGSTITSSSPSTSPSAPPLAPIAAGTPSTITARDLLDGEGSRERRGERLQALDAEPRSLLALGRACAARSCPRRIAIPTPAMTTPTASDAAQRTKSSREAKLNDMRGGVIA